jgi:hypothetical protein
VKLPILEVLNEVRNDRLCVDFALFVFRDNLSLIDVPDLLVVKNGQEEFLICMVLLELEIFSEVLELESINECEIVLRML